MAEVSRDDAWQLVTEWIESDSLRKHLLGVEAAMRAYARKWGEDEETYAVTGLVHDLDYERYPDLDTGHPRYAIKELEERGYPQEVIDAVAGHADFMGVPRETRMAKTLYAVDELSGFVAACALVRPTGIEGMKPKSVKKKLKTAVVRGGGQPRGHPARDRGARRRPGRAHRPGHRGARGARRRARPWAPGRRQGPTVRCSRCGAG